MVKKIATFTFDSDAAGIPRMREFVARWLHDTPLTETDQFDMLLAACEAINNACQHARSDRQAVRISCAGSEAQVSVSVADNGSGFTFDPAMSGREPPLDQPRGRGLFLMHQLADDVRIRPTERGTTVTLVHFNDIRN